MCRISVRRYLLCFLVWDFKLLDIISLKSLTLFLSLSYKQNKIYKQIRRSIQTNLRNKLHNCVSFCTFQYNTQWVCSFFIVRLRRNICFKCIYCFFFCIKKKLKQQLVIHEKWLSMLNNVMCSLVLLIWVIIINYQDAYRNIYSILKIFATLGLCRDFWQLSVGYLWCSYWEHCNCNYSLKRPRLTAVG